MTEKVIVATIKRHLEGQGFLVIKLHGSNFQTAGLPDLLALRDGRAFWFEVKREGEGPTPLQRHYLDLLVQLGFVAAVVRSVGDVRRVIDAEG